MACSCVSILAIALQLDPAALVPLYTRALTENETLYGADHPKVASSARDLGLYLRNIGDRDGSSIWLARALSIHSKTLAADDPQVAEDKENLASVSPPDRALQLHREAANCNDPAISARNWGKVGDLALSRQNRDTAEDAYRDALAKQTIASGATHPKVAVRLNDLSQTVDAKEAERLVRRALAIETRALGAADPATGVTMNNLANVLLALGKLAEAESFARQSLKLLAETLSEGHPRVATISSNLAAILREKPDLIGAQRYYARALAIDEAAYGPNHPEVAVDLRNLAEALQALGKKAEAKRLRDRADSIASRP